MVGKMHQESHRAIFYHIRDLRLENNPALHAACAEAKEVLPIYIYEKGGAASDWYLSESLQALDKEYRKRGSKLHIFTGDPKAVISRLIKQFKIDSVYFNRTFSKHEAEIEKLDVETHSFDGCYLVEPDELMNKSGKPYAVFSPFARAVTVKALEHYRAPSRIKSPSCAQGSFPKSKRDFSKHWEPGRAGALKLLKQFHSVSNYAKMRDLPATRGTSYLSPALHFGEVSPHEVYASCRNATFRSELLWREFANYFLFHFPHADRKNYDSRFDKFPWKKSAARLKKWVDGETGFPIVDAGMRQLEETGWMHNRVRMIVASFLVKDLLIHWREGAEVFMDKLVDADLASNSMNWQWVAGCGVDAAPFFRIFNPELQTKKFDPKGEYVAEWAPDSYEIDPIVDHDEMRKEALAAYKRL